MLQISPGSIDMRVQEVLTSDNRKRYIVVGNDGFPVVPIARYLKYLDSIGRARNTLRTYAHNLQLYFEYLGQKELDYRDVTLDDVSRFIFWLKNPYRSVQLLPVHPVEQARTAGTINQIITTVSGFYDYLWRQDDLASDLNAKMRTYLPARGRAFKSFLHHITAGRPVPANILKQKMPKRRPKTLTKEQIEILIGACGNIRDRLLLTLLYESSIRIGEALSLWLEDIDIPARKLRVRDRGPLLNDAEIKTAASCRDIDVSPELINQIMDYIALAHTDEIDTNHLFVKLHGPNAGTPLSYPDVNSLFCRIRPKTGIDTSAHVLRHSSLTHLAQAGWKPEHLRIRAGHAQFQTTYQMYVHPSVEDMREDWERTEEQMRLGKAAGEGGNT